MLSMPPATMISACPARIASSAIMIAFMPLPQTFEIVVAGTEAARQRPMTLGQRQGVLVAEQIEHEGPQTRPPRGLGQGPAGLRGDQNRAPLRHARPVQGQAQPAISTASL